MHVSPSRIAAGAILADLRQGTMLDHALDRHTRNLDPRDRRFVQELTYGMLRHRGPIDVWLDRRARGGTARLDPDFADLLRLGVYQLLYMNSVPAYAAIAQTVELVKATHGRGGAGLANAVLRRIDRERDSLASELDTMAGTPTQVLAARMSHPEWLVERWSRTFGAADTAQLLERNNHEAPLVLRPWHVSAETLRDAITAAGLVAEDVPWLPDGVQIRGGAALASLSAWRDGHAFVQDPAATLVVHYAAVPPGSTVADLCAAPGGKALELSRSAARVVAVDRSAIRMSRVRDNLTRLQVRNILPVVADAAAPVLEAVDAVVVDAPCTGTGTFRRHPDARWRLRISDIAVSTHAQRAILEAASQSVRPGGLLVYSTCSLEPEENDAQVSDFLHRHPEYRLEPPDPGAVPADVMDGAFLRVLPHRHDVDGAFAARMRRFDA